MASIPIRKSDDVYMFMSILRSKNQLFGDFAIVQFQWGLRFGDCAAITHGQVRQALQHGYVELCEGKTKKMRPCSLNDRVRDVFMLYHDASADPDSCIWSKKIVRETYNLKLKEVALMLGLDANKISSHSLRKSFAYLLRVEHDVSVSDISEQMGHSSTEITLRYCGLELDKKLRLTTLL